LVKYERNRKSLEVRVLKTELRKGTCLKKTKEL
jgi:hypothetical protein